MASQEGAYYVPATSWWPLIGAIGVGTLAAGTAASFAGFAGAQVAIVIGAIITIAMTFGWFRDVALESEALKFGPAEDRSFRWGMGFFIVSEVFFFIAFFGALFYARVFSLDWLSGADVATYEHWKEVVGNTFELVWPSNGPEQVGGDFTPMGAWPLPTINTLILLTSGMTCTIAHHAIKEGQRGKLILFLGLTWLLGLIFISAQAYEYYEAYAHLNLRLDSGIYGSTFFMLTGFHGFHVLIGTLTLLIIWIRILFGHFAPDRHFGFEAAAWYWHFVDVVWLGLYIFVYIL